MMMMMMMCDEKMLGLVQVLSDIYEYLMRLPIRYPLILFLYETIHMRLLSPDCRSQSRKSS